MIYDGDKIYQHISFKPQLQTMPMNYDNHIKDRMLPLMGERKHKPWQNIEPRELMK